jgi:antitoxin component HigA of HigAB toxin-antitoxin module
MDATLPINNEKQYEKAIARLFKLMHARLTSNTTEKKEIEILSRWVEAYEMKFYPLISAL